MSRMILRALAVCVLFVFVGAKPARADGFISPLIGLSFGGDAVAASAGCAGGGCQNKRTSFGISAGTGHGIFGFEEDISYTKEFFGNEPGKSSSVLTIASNFLVRFPTGLMRPYGVFGIAFVRPHATFDAAGFSNANTTLGYNVGGGVEFYMHPKLAVRSDLRVVRTLQNMSFGMFGTEQLQFWRGGAGLTLKF
jgi:opacity protein-like surface antigen